MMRYIRCIGLFGWIFICCGPGCGVGNVETDSDDTPSDNHNSDDNDSDTDTGAGASDADTGDADTDSVSIGDSTSDSVDEPASSMTFVTIEPGSFTMGSPSTEWGRNDNEYIHEVTHIHRYEIATTEVTCAEWKALDTGHEALCAPSASASAYTPCTDDNCPVTGVDLEAAKIWLDALSVSAGYPPCYADDADWPTPMHCPGYRLPTESEWERAARAGDNRATYNGDFEAISEIPANLESIAWCGGVDMSQEDRKGKPVAQRSPNALGLYDMIGNASEITLWDGVYSDHPPDSPYNNTDGDLVAVRGGSFEALYSNFLRCRAASRVGIYGEFAYSDQGFRPVRTLPDSPLPDPVDVDKCPLSIPKESCPPDGMPETEMIHQAREGVSYVDMTHPNACEEIVLLGEDAALGPVIEKYDYWENTAEMLPSSAETGDMRPVAVASVENDGLIISDCRIAAALCGEDGCSLYELSSDDDPNGTLVQMNGGEIPAWLGQEVKLLYLNDPDYRIVVAGNGIASFDGATWTEEVAKDTGGRILSINSTRLPDDEIGVIASGEGGRLLLRDASGWSALSTGVDADLHSAALYNDRSGTLQTKAVGKGGTIVDGPVDDLHSCQVGENDLAQMNVDSSEDGEYELFAADGTHIFQPGRRTGLRTCLEDSTPKDMIKADFFSCGIANNAFHLSKEGLFGQPFVCLID